MCFRCLSVWGHCPADEPYLGAVASQTQIIPGGCGPGPAPTQHAQRCSSGEPEGPRDLRALLQGGSWKTLHRSQRDRPWQLWRGLLCKHQPYNPKRKIITMYSVLLQTTQSASLPFSLQFVLHSQARDVRTSEVVAIKKMSYSGKQTNEVGIWISLYILWLILIHTEAWIISYTDSLCTDCLLYSDNPALYCSLASIF